MVLEVLIGFDAVLKWLFIGFLSSLFRVPYTGSFQVSKRLH